MKKVFDLVTSVSEWAGRIAKAGISLLMLVAFWGAITATSIFGFYFISKAVMAVFSIIALVVGIAAIVWVIGFAWKLLRFFSPKIEPLEAQQ